MKGRGGFGGAGGRLASFAVGAAVGATAGLVAVDLGFAEIVSVWSHDTLVAVTAAAVGGLAWMAGLRRSVSAVTIGLVTLWVAVAYTPLVKHIRRGLARQQAPVEADAVFVFASSLQPDGDPTSEAFSRLMRGIQLVARGYSSRLIVSEQQGQKSYAAVAREWARAFAPRAEIFAVGPIRHTHDEAQAVARLCHERGWKRVLAVTSPAHSRRAAGTLESAGLEVVAVPSIETRFDYETLGSPRDRLEAFAPVLHERIGCIVYHRRGFIR